jgi:hypothetical protein
VAVEYLGGVMQVFQDGNVDAMVAIGLPAHPSLVIEALPPVEMLLVAHAEHAVAQFDGPVSVDDLSEHVELVVSDSSRSSVCPHLPRRLRRCWRVWALVGSRGRWLGNMWLRVRSR